jgi:isopenicillin N synthase-like dioxygenase
MSLPIISIDESNREKIDISKDIGKSCEKYGFFIVKDHNLDISTIKNVKDLSKKFFSLPLKTKMKYHQIGGAGQRGYTPFGIEKAVSSLSPDQKEFWHHGRSNWQEKYIDKVPSNENVSEIQYFDKTLNDLFKDLDLLGKKILSYISLFLDLESDWFDKKINQGNSILRLIHYPPNDKKNVGLRAGPHEDINLVTLLLGTQQKGLEILDQNNNWIPIKTNSEIIVCNVGDMLERLTNKRLISTTHKVVNPKNVLENNSRYSMPFFIHLNPDFFIETINSCINDNNPNIFPEGISADDFLNERLREIKLS